jgi:hypothetical protein
MPFPHVEIRHALEECGASFEELSPAEHRDCLARWIDTYGEFYGDCRRRLRSGRAVQEAQRMSDGHFLLVPCREPSASRRAPVGIAYRCHSGQLPDLTEASHYVDVFISPPDFSWTLLYGHEVDVFGGPDFSCADWSVPPSIERERKR